MDPPPILLIHATLSDIADELRKRYGNVLVLVASPVIGNQNDERPTFEFRGGQMAAIGMAELAAHSMKCQIHDTLKIEPPDRDEEE